MTIQTAVLIETLAALGADIRWASCNIFSTQDHAAAAIAADGIPVFAYKGESLEEYWDFTHRILEWHDGGTPNMILDDGGDATLLVTLGARAEQDRSLIANPTCEEEQVCSPLSASGWIASPAGIPNPGQHQGRHRGNDHRRPSPVHDGEGRPAALPRHQRQRLGHQVQVRQSLRLPRVAGGWHQARHRRDDRRQDRRGAGLRRCRQGLRPVLRGLGATVWVTEIDPICALQAAMEGYRVVTMDEAAAQGRHFRHRHR
jgi:adenosylhomocysteinase